MEIERVIILKKFKSLICVILSALMLTSGFYAYADTIYTWDSSYVYQVDSKNGTGMPFRPADGYVSVQNPPDFTWAYVTGATYNLKVCTDKSMSDSTVAYSASDLNNNYYNFTHTFDVGVDYYWSVQYQIGSSKSEWSTPRKFRIDVDAYEFVVEDIDDIMAKISSNHPRIYSADTSYSLYSLEEFRGLKDKYTYAQNDFNSIIYTADQYVSENKKYTEPETPDTDGASNPAASLDGTVTATCSTVSRDACKRMYNTAMAYMLTGIEKYGNYAKSILLELSGWRYDDFSATGYRRQDQLFREVMYQGAISYDWIYPLLTDAEKTKILTMIENRMNRVDSLITSIKKFPHDSHGWTTIGFMAITAYATIDEISISRGWLEEIIPLYTAVMHPWSNQDGSWCQGLAYYSFSTGFSKELTNILSLGGIVNLYDKAWSKNEYLWLLYAWGPYTYASFGDGSAGYPTTGDALHVQKDIAYFTSNPVAKWMWTVNNAGKSSGLEYFAAPVEDLHVEEPTDYPLSNAFWDIGWAVMTNDLMGRDKVQLTFKSSPYGSFNHSHADQNSFFIQAYGKDLAIKSGYYDSYHTDHDKHFTRQTFAHNSTTIDGGNGQVFDRFDSSGKLTQFVNQMELDSVTGDATEAYFTSDNPSNKLFDKNERSIVYLRPGVFVAIDTLDAIGTKSSTYEWWLNAVDIENSGNTATITNGSVKLDAEALYPEGITSTKYEGFITPDGTEYLPYSGSPTVTQHNRINFSTPSLTKTKMVVVMDVYDEEKAETVNITPIATVSQDKTYMVLEFEEIPGTGMIIKLTDDDEPVVWNGIEFVGDAVTYTPNSIMLTNGYYLDYNGRTLIDADSQKVTVALGCDQMSISSEKDVSLQIGAYTKFWRGTDLSAITDEKGRNVSENNLGIDLGVEEDVLFVNIEKGSHTLLKTVDTALNTYQIVPENVYVKKDAEGNPKVYWDSPGYPEYDISINDVITENVTSGFPLPSEADNCRIMVRSKLSVEKSDWSTPIYYSDGIDDFASYVKYEETEKGVMASQYARAEQNLNFYTAVYDSTGMVGSPKIHRKAEGVFENTAENVDSTNKICSYLWADNLMPINPKSTYKSQDTSLVGIYMDGKLLDGFESSKDYYTVDLAGRKESSFPVITAKAKDNSVKVSVKAADTDTFKAVITVEPSEGTKREITVEFIENPDMHFVKGASEEANFVKDSGRENATSKISQDIVGTISYVNSAGATIVKDLKLYTNFNDRQDGYFGARACNDRHPTTVNHMEIYYVDEALKGYDYFVFGNDSVYKNNNGEPKYTMEFEVDGYGAEVVIIGKNFDGLVQDGFEAEDKLWAKGRYMHVVGNEDVFYNVTYRGKSLSDCVSNGNGSFYMKNYDIMQDWVNVTPPTGYSSLSVDEYFEKAGELSEDMFTEIGTAFSGYVVNWNDMFTTAYTKRFINDGESAKVSFNLTNLGQSARAVVIVKPIATEDAVSRFEFMAPKSFAEIPSKLKRGYSGASDTHMSIDYYDDFKVINGFGNGAKAYVNSDDVICDFNDLCEIDGAMYISPHKTTGEGDGWVDAYYHGISDVSDDNGSYSFPVIGGKSFGWYSFRLNQSANIYIASNGEKPAFADDSWTKINVGTKVFSAGGEDYTDLYAKRIDVEDGESLTVTMPTKGSQNGLYYVFIKPVK